MPFAIAGTTTMNFTFEDRDKNRSTLTLYAPGVALTEDVATWATTTGAGLLQALSNALITKVTLVTTYLQDTYVQPVEESDVERKGRFSYEVDGGGVSTFRIPSFLNTKVIDGTNTINTADAAVIAFQNAMIDAGLFDTVGLGNFRGSALIASATAPEKVHVNSTKG